MIALVQEVVQQDMIGCGFKQVFFLLPHLNFYSLNMYPYLCEEDHALK